MIALKCHIRHGGRRMPDRAALITALIENHPMCLACWAAKANMTAAAVRGYIERLAKTVIVEQMPSETCRVCGTDGPTVSILRGQ